MQRFPPDRFLQPGGDETRYLFLENERCLACKLVKINKPLHGSRVRSAATDDLYQRQEIRWIERVADYGPIRRRTTRLYVAHRQAGCARSDDHVSGYQPPELFIQRLLQIHVFRRAFLHEINVGDSLGQIARAMKIFE